MKQNIKKIKLLFLFILFASIVFLPQTILAATEDDPLEYSINSQTREVSVSGCSSSATSVVIPNEYRGYPVTSISDSAFFNCANLQKVIISDTIEYIGASAFNGCKNLVSIELPNSVSEIDSSAFANCTNLTEVKLSTNLSYISRGMFKNCTHLTTIHLPNSIELINYDAFCNCTSLQSINLPFGLTKIGESSFCGCTSLTSIEIPSSVTAIYGLAFKDCSNLKNVKIPSSVTYFDGDHYAHEGKLFENASSDLVLQVVKGSAAEDYAINNQIDYTVYAYPISVCDISPISNQTYTGAAIKPSVTLTHTNSELSNDKVYHLIEGIDYTLSYKNNIKTGTGAIIIKGIGKYEQTTNATFKILPKPINSATVSGIVNKVYSPNPVTQSSIVVKDGNTLLRNGTDYTISYANNRNVGTATVMINGKGLYTGSITRTFKINTKNIAQTSIAAIASQSYTGRNLTPSLKIKDGNVALIKGTHYTLSYKNNKNIGTATVTIKGIKNYTGTVTKTFKVIPAKATGVKTKNKTTSAITVGWAKKSGITGYEVFMSTRRNSGYKKIKTITKSSTTSFKKTGLTSGKTYYFKVRTYKTIKGKKVYGNYSSILETCTKLKAPTIKKITPSYSTATTKISKVSGATGYEVYLKYKNTYYRYLGDATSTSFYIYNLASSSKYSLKVRAYKIVNGKVVYSPYSKVKTFKTKK